MAAILKMSPNVAYLKNIAYGFIKVSAKSHSVNFFAQQMCLAVQLICL